MSPLNKDHALRLAEDMCNVLISWDIDKSDAFAQNVERTRLMIDRSPNSKSPNRYKYRLTAAIYIYFKYLSKNPSRLGCSNADWKIYPEEKPYKGEFLTDFAIWESGYGLRIASESQLHERKQNQTRVESALDKLLHVRADIKVLVFEDSHENGGLLEHLHRNFLTNYLRFEAAESYLFLQLDGEKVKPYIWCPSEGLAPQLLSQ